jgi:hypothetical protein
VKFRPARIGLGDSPEANTRRGSAPGRQATPNGAIPVQYHTIAWMEVC